MSILDVSESTLLRPADDNEQNDFFLSGKSSNTERITNDFMMPEDEFYLDYKSSFKGEYSWGSFEENKFWSGEGKMYYAFYGEQEEEPAKGEDDELFVGRVPSFQKKKKVLPSVSPIGPEQHRRRSLFVHSSPTHFPDINRARKSVFGSIFVRTTADVVEEAALLRSVVESSYTMLQSLLNSFEKIISEPFVDEERKQNTLAFRDSVQKALEAHGICKTYADGSVHWDIYPISQNYLFSVQIGDNFHHTRNLNRIKDRILKGSIQTFGFLHEWPTNSTWCGHWTALGMSGSGTYIMPHGVSYKGKMQDGMFHDKDATLTYPNKFKAIHCVYEKGKLIDCQFQFPDLLMHEKEDWKYCKIPDRRFWSEVQNGLKPAKIAQETQIDPPKRIPLGAYDTGDGFYYPKSLMLLSSFEEFLRVPVCEEDNWIKKYCRKGIAEPANFRPNLFENWFNYDDELIQSILKEQANFRAGKITYEELQQFYANLGLLPPFSKYKKQKSPSQIGFEEYMKSVPEPKRLQKPKRIKKYHGHQISEEFLAVCQAEAPGSSMVRPLNVDSSQKCLKNFLRFSKNSKLDDSQSGISGRPSKISSKLNSSDQTENVNLKWGGAKKKISEKYLRYQPLLKLPFESGSRACTRSVKAWKSYLRKKPSESLNSFYLGPEDGGLTIEFIKRKNLEKFMKSLILELATNILIKERERHRKRFVWAKKFPRKDPGLRQGTDEQCMSILNELYQSIPDKEEYCDSYPSRTCDLRKLAEDKHNELKYWGKRMFLLDFNEETESE